MNDTSRLLPIGSVVLLNNGTKKVMITGFYSVPANDNSKVYDYCGCLFPEGVVSSEQNLLFDHNQIMRVYYMGYTSEEEKEFKNKLAEIINSGNEAPSVENQPAAPVENNASIEPAPAFQGGSEETIKPSIPVEENNGN